MAQWRPSLESETEGSDRERGKKRWSLGYESGTNRTRSNTVSSSQTSTRTSRPKTQAGKRDKSMTPKAVDSPAKPHPVPAKAERVSSEQLKQVEKSPTSSVSPTTTLSPTVSNVPTTPSVTVAPTEDSDTDFQSAYSASPRESYCDSDDNAVNKDAIRPEKEVMSNEIADEGGFNFEDPPSFVNRTRERAASELTEKGVAGPVIVSPSINP